jgi:hypothetical protein
LAKEPHSRSILDVAKHFDNVWIDGFLYKLTFLNFTSYIIHTFTPYFKERPFGALFLTAT